MPIGQVASPGAQRGAAASWPRNRSRPRPLGDFDGMGKEARSRLLPASRAQPRRVHPIRFQRLAAPGDSPYRGDERLHPAPQLAGHPLHKRADSEGPRQPRQDERRVRSMKEVAISLTYLEEPEEPRQPLQDEQRVISMKEVDVALTYSEEPRQSREEGPRVRAVKEVAVAMTIGVSVGLGLAWGYGLPGAL